MKVTCTVQTRTWYENGQYLGRGAEFSESPAESAAGLMPAFQSDGKPRDRVAELRGHMAQQIRMHRAMARRAGRHVGRIAWHPIPTGDWGEYRLITDAEA